MWVREQRMRFWKIPPPNNVLIDLTYNCNLSCRHCVVNGGISDLNELSLVEIQKIIDELKILGVNGVVFSGGEPLLRSDFFEIGEYAAQKGLKIQISSNGTLITKNIAKKISDLNASIQISLDGSNSNTHDSLRQCVGSWKKAITGIKNLVEFNVPVTVGTVITKLNFKQIPKIYEFAIDLKVKDFRIMPFVPYGRGRYAKNLEISPVEMKKITRYLVDCRSEFSLPITPMEFECTFEDPLNCEISSNAHIGCDGAISYCQITPDGDVLPCNFFYGVNADNVREKSFTWIWYYSHFLNYFRSITISDIKGFCRSCQWLPVCRGSCLAADYASGDIFQSNCHCWLVNS